MAFQPCLACLSTKELWALIALAFCKMNGGDPNTECDPAVLLKDAACLTCQSEKQMLQSVVALILNWAITNGFMLNDTDLRGDVGCMICLSPHQIKAIVLKQFCEGIASGNVFCAQLI